jgi:hypothetical protein
MPGYNFDEALFKAICQSICMVVVYSPKYERNLFERLVKAARGAGLITKDAAQLLESSQILGAAGARDTYTLIRGAIRKLLRSLGYASTSRAGLPERLWWYIDPATAQDKTRDEGRTGRAVALFGAEHGPAEDHGPRLRRGVAKDRVLSVVDPQMRCGHKSRRQAWAGYKVHIAEEPESELITEVEVRPASGFLARIIHEQNEGCLSARGQG